MARPTEKQREEARTILTVLEAAGWTPTTAADLLGKAELEYENPRALLRVEHRLRESLVYLYVYDSDGAGQIKVATHYGRRLHDYLDLLISFQDDMNADTYKRHLNDLVKAFRETDSVHGEEFTRLHPDDE